MLHRNLRHRRITKRIGPLFLLTIPSLALLFLLSHVGFAESNSSPGEPSQQNIERGQHLYKEQCASCHGEQGQGVDGGYTSQLTGDFTVQELSQLIHETMPEGEPEKCVDQDALAVAQYIHQAFYSVEAQNRINPPKQTFARLTGNQLRKSVADLYGHFAGVRALEGERGVRGRYFEGDRMRKESEKITRTDAVIDFDFGKDGPGEGIPAESFYIYWEGSILPEQTGLYEFVIRSSCSFRFSFGKFERQLIDNHVQSGDKTEFRQSIYLTAGRPYPFKIDFVQRKRKTEQPPANIRFGWVPPHGVEEVIPESVLIPAVAPPAFSLQALLPPDDRSYGFERGVSISKQWDESTTAAAIEFAQIATQELFPKYLRDRKDQPNDERQILKAFLRELLSVAFHGPISDEVFQAYVVKQLEVMPDDAEAIKRVVLLGLKSPRFLYPLADSDRTASRKAANRLALTLYDSLPSDPWLIEAADKDQLEDENQIRNAAKRMVRDHRAQAKIREAIHEWLNLGHVTELTKSSTLYPEFNAALVQDLKRSLNAQIDEIAFSDAGDFRQFFNGKSLYTSSKLAAFYGGEWQLEAADAAENSRTGRMIRKEIADAPRYGLLTHPLLLSALAYHDSTSPIHRGVFLLRFVLGRTLRPPNDAFSPLSPDLHPDLSTRERVALQTSSDNCQICHIKINPLGFVLENYDAVGKFRSEDRGKGVDATGSYRGRNDIVAEFTNASDLADYLAESPDSQRAFITRLFQHMVKQPPDAFGPETLKILTDRFRESRYNIQELAVEIGVVAAQNR